MSWSDHVKQGFLTKPCELPRFASTGWEEFFRCGYLAGIDGTLWGQHGEQQNFTAETLNALKSASQGSLVKIEYDLEEDKDVKESKLMCVQEWDDGVKGFKGPHFALAFYCGKTFMTLATTSLQTPNVMDATQIMVKYLESISVV